MPIYEKNKLVLISSGTTTTELTNKPSDFFFRVVNNTKDYAIALAEYLNNYKQIAIFYNPGSPFSYSLREDFTKTSELLWGETILIRTMLTYDATLTLIEAFRQQEKPTRKGTQKILADDDFKANGVTGEIKFCPDNGDRQDPQLALLDIRKNENKNSKYNLEFYDKEYYQIKGSCGDNPTLVKIPIPKD